MTSLTIHPVANLFPPMDPEQFRGLVEDIKTNGQREPIAVYQGAVIDGVHRLKACQELGREPATAEWTGDEGGVMAYVISMNLHRRHLSTSQRAMIAAKLTRTISEAARDREDRKRAPEQKHSGAPVMTRAQAAEAFRIGEATVESARTVLREGSSELVAAVERDEVPVYTAARAAARYRKDEQLAQAKTPKKQSVRDPMKPKRLPTVPVLDRIDRSLDTLDTLMEAVFTPATEQMNHDRRRSAWAERAREVRTALTRFITRCEEP